MERILYSGFKGQRNSSFRLVSAFRGDKVFLTNSFEGIFRDIELLDTGYERVIMFGADKILTDSIRFELLAKKDSVLLRTRADLSEYCARAAESALEYAISKHPTHYLCNEAYYQMMQKMDCPVLFVHIPTLKNSSTDFIEKLISVFQ